MRCGVAVMRRHLEDPRPDQVDGVGGALSPTLQVDPELQEQSCDADEDSHHHAGVLHQS